MGEALCRGTTEGANCAECPFSNAGQPHNPVVSEFPDDPAWIIIGEGPGFNETRQGRPFIGASGQVVNGILKRIGRDRDHLYIGNATLCQPSQGSPIEERERAAACCAPRLQKELAWFPGKPVLTLGAVAARSVIPKAVLDAIDPPDVPKSKKRAQKDKQKSERKAERKKKTAIEKIAVQRFNQLEKEWRKNVIHDLVRKTKRKPDDRYWHFPEQEKARGALWRRAQSEAPRIYEQKVKERTLAKAAKVKTKKPGKKKPIKITDIVGTLFDVDVDGTGVRPVIPAIHPAALLHGGGATIGGSHTPDMAYVNLTYDAAKIDALARGKDIRLQFDFEFEVDNAERANRLFVEAMQDALDEGAYSLDLETYVDDPDRHHALMAYVAKIRVIGIATHRRAFSVAWDFLDGLSLSYLQLVLGRATGKFHNGLYDRTVLRAYGFIIPTVGLDEDAPGFEDCYLDSETEFLTNHGWLSYDRIDKSMLLATIDHRGRLQWQRYFDRVSKPYNGTMYVFETNHTRAVVTPNHRMWCQPLRRTSTSWRGSAISSWGFTRADKMLFTETDTFAIQQTCEPCVGGQQLEQVKLQLLGLWLADGYVRFFGGKPREIIISQKKNGRASTLLAQLSKHFPLRKTEHVRNESWRKRAIVEELWHLADSQIASEFARLGKRSINRRLPDDVFNWSRDSRVILLEALFLGDGSEHGGKSQRFIYRSGSEALADGVQALALSIGWVATNPRTYRPDGICHVFISRAVEVSKAIRTRLGVANSSVTSTFVTDGRIVCFSVPNETLVTRSRGKPAFYGNTLLAHHAAFPGNSHKLQVVTSQFFGVSPWKSEFRNQEETPTQLAIYNAKDTASTHAIAPPLQVWVKRTTTERIYARDKRMSDIASRMHINGQPVDRDVNTQLYKTFSHLARDARRKVESQATDPRIVDRVKHKLALLLAGKKRKKDEERISPLRQMALEAGHKIDEFEELYKLRKRDLDDENWYWKINNSKHIAAFLQAVDAPLTALTEGGTISTKKDVLESLVDIPIVRDLLEYRENNKMLDFVEPIFDRTDATGAITTYGFADPFDRIHPIWSIHKISGRWAGSEPMGTSNPPREKTKKVPFGTTLPAEAIITGYICECGAYEHDKKKHEGHVFKHKFIEYAYRPTTKRQIRARNGRKIVGFDFAQVEARIIALISGDPFMCDVFGRDGDLHTECAQEVFPGFNDKTASERKMMRTVCKTLEYATWYGAADEKVWKGLLKEGYTSLKLKDVVGSLNRLRRKMNGVIAWQRKTIAQASQPPFELRDVVSGRRRVWPMGQVEASEALNIVPQSTGAALMNEGMEKMDDRLLERGYKEAFCISQIHDAAYFECWEDDAESIAKDIDECFTSERTNAETGVTVKFTVETGIGDSLADV